MTDVVIIGAGPAGTTCAYLLKKAGMDCVLVDFAAFPREKICGGGLTIKAYHLLEEIMPEFRYEYKSIRRLQLQMDARTLCTFAPAEELRVVSRKDFDHALLQQYLGIGGAFVQDAFYQYEILPDGTLLVTLKSGKQISCKYLVGADGANSRVRNQLKGHYDGNMLALEQYIPPSKDAIEGEISRKYDEGYYYLFPGVGHDVVGFCDRHASVERFRALLAEKGIPETRIHGAFIPTEVAISDNDRIILIGDAGGYANRLTYEGLYYAFATGRNAFLAISQGVPFRETNREIIKKKQREKRLTRFFYSRAGRCFVRICSASPALVRRIFDRGVKGR